ncbi:MAG: hypothetical protein GHCLOJNM_02331 [bacterium]|nr:hypothetical protein [bacterium]
MSSRLGGGDGRPIPPRSWTERREVVCRLLRLSGMDFPRGGAQLHRMELDKRGAGLRLRQGATKGWVQAALQVAPFHRAIPSWNIRQPPGTGARVEIRAVDEDEKRTPWLHLDMSLKPGGAKHSRFWTWRIDELRSEKLLFDCEVRISFSRTNLETDSPTLDCFYLATQTLRRADKNRGMAPPDPAPTLQVPFLNQYEADAEIGARICSATSSAMALRALGVEVSPSELARPAYHPGHDLYGIWPLAIQAAYQKGVRGWVEIFSDWRKPIRLLRKGVPIVASVAFRDEELRHPPYPSTDGHLVVLLGVAEGEKILTHDPRLPEDVGAFLRWDWRDFSAAWFGHGGVGYVYEGRVR